MLLRLVATVTAFTSCACAAMPVAQQNALVKQYCAGCHTDAARSGGLTLEHFDSAHVDPTLAAMMLAKLDSKALGASGQKLPDQATQDAFSDAFRARAAGAEKWFVHQDAGALSASSAVSGRDMQFYRLIVTCHEESHKGEIQLSWVTSPRQDRVMSAQVDEEAPLSHSVAGWETKGAQAGYIRLSFALPKEMLRISNIQENDSPVFAFSELDTNTRQRLAECFKGAQQ